MQIKDITSKKEGSLNKWFWITIKLGITCFCIYFLISQLNFKKEAFDGISIPNGFVLFLAFQLFLMVLNWYLEIKRWQISLYEIETISFHQAGVDVLSGLALGWVLPFTSGDLFARLAARESKMKSLGAILLNRSIMLVFTLLIGMKGLSYLIEIKTVYLLLGTVAGLLCYFIWSKIPSRISSYFLDISSRTVIIVILLSIFRYTIFLLQFVLMISFFLPELLLQDIVWGVGWVFLSRSFIPSLFGGLGVREVSAYLFFEPLVGDIALIILPVTLIWLINTVLPSIAGVLLIWKLRIKLARWPLF